MRTLLSCALILALACVASRADEDKPEDTPKAAKTRKLLKTKVKEIEWKDTRFAACMDELKDLDEVKKVGRLSVRFAPGISRNRMITFKTTNKTVAEVLDEVCKKVGGIGYVVISNKKDPYDGSILIRQGEERGYEKKKS
jgi:hypothetical protein